MRKVLWLTLAICIGFTNADAQTLSDLRLSVFGGGSFVAANRTFTVDGDIFNVVGGLGVVYSCFATNSLGPVVVTGQGKVRVMCEKCFISKFGAFQTLSRGASQ